MDLLALAELAEREDASDRRRTDGSFRRLARDLPRLLNSAASGLGADITLPAEALHAEVRAFAEDRGEDAESFAFRGGEDYTLLGSCPPLSACFR